MWHPLSPSPFIPTPSFLLQLTVYYDLRTVSVICPSPPEISVRVSMDSILWSYISKGLRWCNIIPSCIQNTCDLPTEENSLCAIHGSQLSELKSLLWNFVCQRIQQSQVNTASNDSLDPRQKSSILCGGSPWHLGPSIDSQFRVVLLTEELVNAHAMI